MSWLLHATLHPTTSLLVVIESRLLIHGEMRKEDAKANQQIAEMAFFSSFSGLFLLSPCAPFMAALAALSATARGWGAVLQDSQNVTALSHQPKKATCQSPEPPGTHPGGTCPALAWVGHGLASAEQGVIFQRICIVHPLGRF